MSTNNRPSGGEGWLWAIGIIVFYFIYMMIVGRIL